MAVMATVTNTWNARRTWGAIADTEKNRPLTLDPGESARVDLPMGFTDPYLKVEFEAVKPFVPQRVSSFVPPAEPAAEEPSDPEDQE